MSANPIFCAIDARDPDRAEALARAVAPFVGGLKLGLEFFCAQGPAGIARLAGLGAPVFLDLKLHDIPNTVAGAVRAVAPLAPALLTVHASGGLAMMQAAAEAAAEAGPGRPRLLGVTALTSLDAADLDRGGIALAMTDYVRRLAELALRAGLDGVVASPHEIELLRADLGGEALIVVPGIRPAGAAAGDQKRMMGPAEAMRLGASRLVIGRPITAAADPAGAAEAIARDLGGHMRGRG